MGSGVRRVDSDLALSRSSWPQRENFERDEGGESTGKNAREKDFNDREYFGILSKLRGSWQIETIEVAETIQLGNLASKCGVWEIKFYSSIYILATFPDVKCDCLIFILIS